MKLEIERHFLIKDLPLSHEEFYKLPKQHIAQVYLEASDGVECRVRRLVEDSGEVKYFMTHKSELDTPNSNSLVRKEIEFEISEKLYLSLIQVGIGSVVKDRYKYTEDGVEYTIDKYISIPGLMVAEVEYLSDDDESGSIYLVKPKWLGKEVTKDSRYRMKNLINVARRCQLEEI